MYKKPGTLCGKPILLIDPSSQVGTDAYTIAPEDLQRLIDKIDYAQSVEEVERFQAALRMGIIPEGLLSDDTSQPGPVGLNDVTPNQWAGSSGRIGSTRSFGSDRRRNRGSEGRTTAKHAA